MLRITKFRTYATLSPADITGALQAATQTAESYAKVKGVSSCRAYVHNSDIVFVTEADSYAASDAVHGHDEAQIATGRLFMFGYRPVEDEFFNDIERIHTLVKKAAMATAR